MRSTTRSTTNMEAKDQRSRKHCALNPLPCLAMLALQPGKSKDESEGYTLCKPLAEVYLGLIGKDEKISTKTPGCFNFWRAVHHCQPENMPCLVSLMESQTSLINAMIG